MNKHRKSLTEIKITRLMTESKTKQQNSLTPFGFFFKKGEAIIKNIKTVAKIITRALKPKTSRVRTPFMGNHKKLVKLEKVDNKRESMIMRTVTHLLLLLRLR
jgi:hypothetical protein